MQEVITDNLTERILIRSVENGFVIERELKHSALNPHDKVWIYLGTNEAAKIAEFISSIRTIVLKSRQCGFPISLLAQRESEEPLQKIQRKEK